MTGKATGSGRLASLDGGDTKPTGDTKERIIIGRGGPEADEVRYPIGCLIVAVNGGGASYDVLEVDSDGILIFPNIAHAAVNNIGDAILEVGDFVPLFYNAEDKELFLARRTRDAVISCYTGPDDGVLRFEHRFASAWVNYHSKFDDSGIWPYSFMSNSSNPVSEGVTTLTDLLEVDDRVIFDIQDAVIAEDEPPIVFSGGDLSFPKRLDLSYTHVLSKISDPEAHAQGEFHLIIPGLIDPVIGNRWLILSSRIVLGDRLPAPEYSHTCVLQEVIIPDFTNVGTYLNDLAPTDSYSIKVRWTIHR